MERLKKNTQFGAIHTAVSVMPIGAVAALSCEAMSLSIVVRLR